MIKYNIHDGGSNEELFSSRIYCNDTNDMFLLWTR